MNPTAQNTPRPDLDAVDKRLLNRLQFDFSLSDRPWDAIANDFGLIGPEVLARVRRLKDTGLIRQISAIFDTRSLGYTSTLAAARVPESRIDAAAAIVNRHPGVSHNYRRDAEFNLWFTLAAPPGESLEDHLHRLATEAGFEDYLALPTLRTFRIGVKLNLDDDEEPPPIPHVRPAVSHPHPNQTQPYPLTETDKAFIRALQDDLPLVDRPFEPACTLLNIEFDQLRDWMIHMQDAGVMRRFAAILRHRQAGFTANGLVVWQVPDDVIEPAGRLAAELPEVSHCYQRPSLPAWPYSLYTMIHARSKEECRQITARLADRLKPLGITTYRTLYSRTEYKKQRVRYWGEG